ncbi:MAG: hypothetical protein ACLP50_22945 [Solirubrobacteraceae bacterium]
MTEDHHIVGRARGEPLPAGRVGIRVRVQLSGCPSRRWSRALSARLALELVGHAAVGHLRLNDLIQGNQIVLEGVEATEAPSLTKALRRAVDAANDASTEPPDRGQNMTQQVADAIASDIDVS